MKRLLPSLLLAMFLPIASCDMGIEYPPDPKDCAEDVVVSRPFSCTYYGVIVLEGFLTIRQEDYEKYDVEEYLSGQITCGSESYPNLQCHLLP